MDSHSTCHLQLPIYGRNPPRRNAGPKPKPAYQEIPSRVISIHQLNSLLLDIFPAGEYDVDIDQNVYKIRAPRAIREVEIFKRGS
ncbi:hypothetical protein B0T25DRAFT_552176 [Lasiosphaeria hispida]|uniref:Uncharacterized protein n=1 Tax=Lasiosphaeria hispida TaxID=260671 RepID=A0AAJ0HBE4_9PEZI|nr:hypothetical protein B0T25DRAFT_552176 [Lasiosphaeria hispida]